MFLCSFFLLFLLLKLVFFPLFFGYIFLLSSFNPFVSYSFSLFPSSQSSFAFYLNIRYVILLSNFSITLS